MLYLLQRIMRWISHIQTFHPQKASVLTAHNTPNRSVQKCALYQSCFAFHCQQIKYNEKMWKNPAWCAVHLFTVKDAESMISLQNGEMNLSSDFVDWQQHNRWNFRQVIFQNVRKTVYQTPFCKMWEKQHTGHKETSKRNYNFLLISEILTLLPDIDML